MNEQTGQIATGSAEGLYDFCDWLIRKGLMSSSAVEPLRSATKQIVGTVDADADPSMVNVGDPAFDVESYMDRFEKIAGSRYAPDSLNAYRRRFRRAIELYRQYLKDGAANFKAPTRRAPRRRPMRENGPGVGSNVPAVTTPPSTPPAASDLIDYPFPLRSGQIAHLHLPARLEKGDADRMAVLIRALVFEPQPQLGQGEEED
jgi:hypothetical protein